MFLSPSIAAFQAQRAELKIASYLALISATAALAVTLWSTFSQPSSSTKPHLFNPSQTVQTVATPDSLIQQELHTTKSVKKQSATPLQRSKATTGHQLRSPKPNTSDFGLGQGNYYVQVGAFTQSNLARLMLKKMKKHYKYAKIKIKPSTYAVWVGPVITKQNATTLKKHLQLKNNIRGFIVTNK